MDSDPFALTSPRMTPEGSRTKDDRREGKQVHHGD
jgi:hypothetical protein